MIVPIVKCGDCRVKNNNLLPVQVFFLGGGEIQGITNCWNEN